MAVCVITRKWSVLITILCYTVILGLGKIQAKSQVPCAFFFGDSQFDNGNNNALLTFAKTNYPPYGIDYPGGATGRFTDGRNIPDFITESLGFPNPIPPFTTAKGPMILQGVNYASGGAGILDFTGTQLGERVPMNEQILNHIITISSITRLLGASDTKVNNYLNRCLYTISIGSNDYLNNVQLPRVYITSERFAEILIQNFEKQLKTLYEYGARKIAIFGVGVIGCILQKVFNKFPRNGSECNDSLNEAVQRLDVKFKPLIDGLNSNFKGAQFTYINYTNILSLSDTALLGNRVTNAPCCETIPQTGLCVENGVVCNNRSEYIFFDNYHSTEDVYKEVASRAYMANSPADSYPFDIRSLVQL